MSINISRRPSANTSQSGIVSIFVTMIMIIVISLIVIGFAQVARTEQRQSLDNQLSSQAYYAAESGVNDVADVLSSATTIDDTYTKNTCNNSGTPYSSLVPALSAGVSYTCVLVDTTVPVINGTLSSNAQAIPLKDKNGAAINTLTFTWYPAAGPSLSRAGCPSAPSIDNINSLPTAANWSATCSLPLIQMDLVPVSGGLTHAGLMRSTMTAYIFPTSSTIAVGLPYSGSANIYGGAVQQGIKTPSVCANATPSTPPKCSITVSGLGQTQYYIRLKSFYRNDATFTLTGNGGSVEFEGAQADVDATGKSEDTLRRIKVSLPLTSGQNGVDNAITSYDSICKRFSVFTGYLNSGATCNDQND